MISLLFADKSFVYNSPVNPRVLREALAYAGTVLDVGCGCGALGRHLSDDGVVVDGVTNNSLEASAARFHHRNIYQIDIERGLGGVHNTYDVLVLSHVLEHLVDPGPLLLDCLRLLAPAGVIVCAIPNLLVLSNRLKLFRGQLRYEPIGLMDFTHVRWYTWDSLVRAFEAFGFELIKREAYGHIPLGPIRKVLPAALCKHVDAFGLSRFPGLFGNEFVYTFRARRP